MDAEKQKKEPDKRAKPHESALKRFAKLDIKKKIQYAAILLVIIVILAIYFASFGSEEPEQDTTSSVETESSDVSDIEEKLMQTLSCIEGAGQVSVMITYESSAEIVPAVAVDTQITTTTDESESGSSTTTSENTQREIVTVGSSNGSSALVLREESPQIKGVLVIAEGADDIRVKLDLLSAVQTILNITPDKVDVYKMNNE